MASVLLCAGSPPLADPWFRDPIDTAMPGQLERTAHADFNQDGLHDLASKVGSSLQIYTNTGKGHLDLAKTLQVLAGGFDAADVDRYEETILSSTTEIQISS